MLMVNMALKADAGVSHTHFTGLLQWRIQTLRSFRQGGGGGGGGGGHSDPEIKGARSQIKCPSGLSLVEKVGEAGPPWAPPLDLPLHHLLP